MKTIFILFFVMLTTSIYAYNSSSYYPDEVDQKFKSMKIKNEKLLKIIKDVLKKAHVKNKNGGDVLVRSCSKQRRCYKHQELGYKEAKKYLFGKLHLKKDGHGFYIEDIYCQKIFDNNTANIRTIGPMQIPNSDIINCEHTWPQSRFSRRYSKRIQKGDLHHLYPSDQQANSIRGNYRFGDVDSNVIDSLCHNSTIGRLRKTRKSWKTNRFFAPPVEHRGNVARSIFYFSVRYDLPITQEEEKSLKIWHKEDPVDNSEMLRNEQIYKIQKNRNPFIDYPSLVGLISNF